MHGCRHKFGPSIHGIREITRGDDGRPLLTVRGTVAEAAEKLGVRQWHVTLSHDAGLAKRKIGESGTVEEMKASKNQDVRAFFDARK